MSFWIIAALMILGGLIMLVPALLRRHNLNSADAKQSNITIAQERLSELEAELAAGSVAQATFDQAKEELEHGLLDDVSVDADSQPDYRDGKGYGRGALLSLVMFIPAATIGIYMVLGSPQYLSVSGPGVQQDPHSGGGGRPASMEEMVAKLEQKVAANPKDPEGMFMLGRVYASMGRYADAAKVLQEMRPLVDDHPAVLVALADARAMENGGKVSGEPYDLVRLALEKEPENVTALWLAGNAAMEQSDHQNAIYYWRQAEAGLADEPEMLAEIQQLIRDLLKDAQAAGITLDDPGPVVVAQVAASGVQLSVALSPELQAKLTGNELLFIFAKAVSGPPMPIAAIRRSAAELPLVLALDDNAMLQGGKLTDHQQLKIAARVTRGGGPAAKSGDFQSVEIIFQPGTDQELELLIDQVVP